MAQVSAFTGMRVEPADQDARPGDAELVLQVGVQDSRDAFQALRRDCIGNLAKGQVSGHQGYAQAARGQHHHHLRGVGQVGEEFRMPGKGDAGFVDHAFVHRRGNHAGEISAQAALAGAGQGFQYEGSVGLVQLPGDDLGVERCIPDIQAVGWRGYIRPAVRCDRQQIDSHAQLRGPLNEQVAAGNGNQGVRLGLRGEQQAQVGTYAGRFTGCQRETFGFHCAAWSAPGSLISTYASSRI
ncbi:hypothetical protein D3C71_1168450 [compost metagenome]